MEKKSKIVLLVIVVIGAAFLFNNELIEFAEDLEVIKKPIPIAKKKLTEDKEYDKLYDIIDRLKIEKWNNNRFSEIKSKLDDAHSTFEVIDISAYNSLLALLETNYNTFVKKAFKKWKQSCESDHNLHKEIHKLYTAFPNVFREEVKELYAYQRMQGYERKVDNLLLDEYNTDKVNSLKRSITDDGNKFTNCSQIQNIKLSQMRRLLTFATIKLEFQQHIRQFENMFSQIDNQAGWFWRPYDRHKDFSSKRIQYAPYKFYNDSLERMNIINP